MKSKPKGLTRQQQRIAIVIGIIAGVMIVAALIIFLGRSSGTLIVRVNNYTSSTISYQLYIDGKLDTDSVASAGFYDEITFRGISEGTHTITVSVPSRPSQSQTKYMPSGGLVAIEFSFY